MMMIMVPSSLGGIVTKVDLHRAETAALEAQALIEEARACTGGDNEKSSLA